MMINHNQQVERIKRKDKPNNKYRCTLKCTKKKFNSLSEVKIALSETKKRGREEIRFYRCFICKSYHLTSKKRKLIREFENENTECENV